MLIELIFSKPINSLEKNIDIEGISNLILIVKRSKLDYLHALEFRKAT